MFGCHGGRPLLVRETRRNQVLDNDAGGGAKLENLWNKEKPKSTLLADNTRGLGAKYLFGNYDKALGIEERLCAIHFLKKLIDKIRN